MSYGNRVSNFSTSRAAAAVVDSYLDSTTLASRLMAKGKKFAVKGRGEMPTLIKNIKVGGRTQGQWLSGLEQLNSAAEDVTVQMEYNHAAYSMPVVDVLVEAMAREGAGEDVDYPAFNYEDALDTTIQDLSDAFYGYGVGKRPLGLEAIVDDGTNKASIGGLSRTTYSNLNASVTATGGALTLSKMAAMHSGIRDTGRKEDTTVIVTDYDTFDLYESLLTPTVTHEYKKLPITGDHPIASDNNLSMGQGFNTLSFRGIPVIPDKQATDGVMYFLNENYLAWHGRSKVPSEYKDFLKKVSLGKSVKEGQLAKKLSKYHGFFYQEKQMMPTQGGIISRFWVFGQLVSFQPRRQGKLTGISSVA